LLRITYGTTHYRQVAASGEMTGMMEGMIQEEIIQEEMMGGNDGRRNGRRRNRRAGKDGNEREGKDGNVNVNDAVDAASDASAKPIESDGEGNQNDLGHGGVADGDFNLADDLDGDLDAFMGWNTGDVTANTVRDALTASTSSRNVGTAAGLNSLSTRKFESRFQYRFSRMRFCIAKAILISIHMYFCITNIRLIWY
jgi:hypothetical protein